MFHIALLALLLAAERTPAAKVTELAAAGRVADLRFGDVDGDGRADALLTVVSGSGSALQRQIQVHLQGPAGFSRAANGMLTAARDVLFADVADVEGDSALELLTVDTQGVNASSWRGGVLTAPRRLLEIPSFFRAMSTAELAFVAVAKDLDFDGRKDLLIPGRDGYALFRRLESGGFAGPFPIESEPRHGVRYGENAFFRLTARLARPSSADWDGDGVGDLLLAFEQKLLRIVLGPSGAPGPASLLLDLDQLLGATAGEKDGLVLTAGQLRDVDEDGRCDLLLTRKVAKPSLLAGVATRTLLFLSSDLGKGAAPKPRQAIVTEGLASEPRLIDFDRNGALDLVVTAVRTDALTKLKETVLDAVTVTFFIYPFLRDEQRFAAEPMFSDSLALPAERLVGVGADGYLALDGDFDGDGRPDYARYDATKRELVVRRGYEDDGFFSSTPIAFQDEPFARSAIELPGKLRAVDVDADGRAEIVSFGDGKAIIVEFPR